MTKPERLVIIYFIPKAVIIAEQVIRSVRPSEGCSPKYLPELLGKASDREYKFEEPIVHYFF